MKMHSIVLPILLVFSFSASLASAAFDVPSYVYDIDKLQQAQKDAKAGNRQIVFLYSNKNTDCSLASRASIGIIQRFKDSAVIVYIGRGGWPKVPRIVKEAINSPAAGRFIPKTVVVDSEIRQVVSIIPYKRPGK
jgi:hypothetical protein